jgi:hypothetical protein
MSLGINRCSTLLEKYEAKVHGLIIRKDKLINKGV